MLSLNLTSSKPLITTVKAGNESCDAYNKSKADYDYWIKINPGKSDQNWVNQLEQMKRDCDTLEVRIPSLMPSKF